MSAIASMNKRKKMMTWTGIIMLLAIVLLPMSGYLLADTTAEEPEATQTNPRADYWRKIRDNAEGYSAVKGRETNELIQGSGQVWRELRNGPMATYGSWLIFATLLALGGFYAWRGQVKLTHPKTGKTVERWSLVERRLHWITAGLFIVLAVTGLSLLYGRHVLVPVFGHAGFSAYATVAKWLHNMLGPLFMIGLFIMIVKWFRHNFLNKIDIQWFMAFGGMVGDKHPSAERMNGGEKMWFWTLATAGVALCLSGLVLDFPNFDQERELIQLSHVVHLLTALILISFAFGHIYIGTIGTEGALEGMTTGQVDVAWAEQHHDLWLAELQRAEQSSPKSDL